MSRSRYLPLLAACLMLGLPSRAALAAATDVEALLALTEPPAGVVFEVVSANPRALERTLPQARDAIRRLRERFPGLPAVIVSHGSEQFALLQSAAAERPAVHQAVRSLLSDDDVPVQVCGTHAGWRGKRAEDFPDYVGVAVSGPAQINDYVALGYALVLLRP